MLDLESIGSAVRNRRRELGWTQPDVASRARVSRSTIAALETGRVSELGFARVSRILGVLGLGLQITTAVTRRPTLEELTAQDQALRHRR